MTAAQRTIVVRHDPDCGSDWFHTWTGDTPTVTIGAADMSPAHAVMLGKLLAWLAGTGGER